MFPIQALVTAVTEAKDTHQDGVEVAGVAPISVPSPTHNSSQVLGSHDQRLTHAHTAAHQHTHTHTYIPIHQVYRKRSTNKKNKHGKECHPQQRAQNGTENNTPHASATRNKSTDFGALGLGTPKTPGKTKAHPDRDTHAHRGTQTTQSHRSTHHTHTITEKNPMRGGEKASNTTG